GRAAGIALPPLPDMASLTLPQALPAVVPSDLVARRPDVRAAQAQLEGAGADVGAAIAARLPSIQLGANAGGAAQRFGDMFATGNPFWSLIGG
ncbi:TolC family protein, partial [Enterococcus faecium]|uniref:TolC family protein n=3 Tax=Bacteria TaxID=2 RepID=UPI003F42986D